MASVNDRRDRRFDVRIPVAILSLRGEVKALTENASYRGILLRTDQAPPKRQLVRLRITVPTETKDILTNGMVVHVAQNAGLSLVGVSFFGLDGETRASWEEFIRFVQAHEQSVGKLRTAAETPSGNARRRELVVAVASAAALERLVSRDVARGTLLIHAADSSLDAGAAVSVRLVHPVTQADFMLEGHVRRRLEGGGLKVDLASMSAEVRAKLMEFTAAGEEGFEVVDLASLQPPARSMESQAFG